MQRLKHQRAPNARRKKGRKASDPSPEAGLRRGRRRGAPTYRGGEAAPQGLELSRAKILPQVAARGRGRLHAPAVGRCLGEGKGRTRVAGALAPAPSQRPAVRPVSRDPSCPAGITPPDTSLPRAHRPPGARGRRGGGFALAPTPLRSRTSAALPVIHGRRHLGPVLFRRSTA